MCRSLLSCVLLVVASSVPVSAALPAQDAGRALRSLAQLDYVAARADIQRLRDATPPPRELPYLLGRLALIDHNVPEAVRELEQAVERDGEDADRHFWLGMAVAEATKIASVVKQPFMAKRIMRLWERAVELDPDHVDARAQLVAFYSIVPGFMGGSKEKARAHVAQIERTSKWRSKLALGALLEQEGMAPEAVDAYRQAIAAAPDSGAGYFALSYVYARSARAEEAFSLLRSYSSRRPDDQWVRYHTGRLSAVTGVELERGATELARFLAEPPSDLDVAGRAQAHYRCGQVLEKLGRSVDARVQYGLAVNANPHHTEARKSHDRLKRARPTS